MFLTSMHLRLLTVPALLVWALVEIVALQRTRFAWRIGTANNSNTKVTELTHFCHTSKISS